MLAEAKLNYLVNGKDNQFICVLAHGAGAPMDSEWMETFAKGLASHDIKVIRFEFPYMQERRLNGKKRPPNRQSELVECFNQVLTDLNEPCVIAGKSMGGRMASILVSDGPLNNVKGVLALGYPFHPQGKPEKLRIDHLPNVSVPMSIVQGTRDKLGDKETVEGLLSKKAIPSDLDFLWLEDGDHDLKPRVKSGFTKDEHMQAAIEHSAEFIKKALSAV